jgi:hypothetical protein
MSARTLIDELKRRLLERGVAVRERTDQIELDFALIERIYEIAPAPVRVVKARPPR